MSRVELHIEALVLEGVRHEDRHAVAAGLQAELVRLLENEETARRVAGLGDTPERRLNDVHIAHGSKVDAIGAQVARGIVRGVTG